MTPTRRLLRLEAVEDRCLPSGFRPAPATHGPAPGGPERYDFRGADDDHRGRPEPRGERADVVVLTVVAIRPVPAKPALAQVRVADTSDQTAFAKQSDYAPAAAAGDAIFVTPPALVRAVRLPATSVRVVSAVVADGSAVHAVEVAPSADRLGATARVAPPAELVPTPTAASAPATVTTPARDLADVSAARPAAVASPATPLTVSPADPSAAAPEPDPAPAPVADLPPVVAVAQGLVAAVVPPLLPLAGVVPIDLVAVEAAATELLAQLTAADPTDGWTPAGRWGWLGAAVLAAGGLAHAARPAADRRATPPGADSALARWESRHARR